MRIQRFLERQPVSLSVSERMGRVMPSATSAVLGLAAELREAGRPVISLGAGEPDFDTPDHIKAAAIQAIRDGETKYTAIDGTRHLKGAIQRKFERDNLLSYAPEQILVSVGAKHTLFNAVHGHARCRVTKRSSRPLTGSRTRIWSAIAEAAPRSLFETGIEDGLQNHARDQLSAAITDRTRLLFLNSPSNPTGSCYTRAELAALGDVLRRHPERRRPCRRYLRAYSLGRRALLQYRERPAPTCTTRHVTINGVSKCYAMTGWRVGYAGGPVEVIKAMKTIQSQMHLQTLQHFPGRCCRGIGWRPQACMEPMLEAYKSAQ